MKIGTICGNHHADQDVRGIGGRSDKKCGKLKRAMERHRRRYRSALSITSHKILHSLVIAVVFVQCAQQSYHMSTRRRFTLHATSDL